MFIEYHMLLIILVVLFFAATIFVNFYLQPKMKKELSREREELNVQILELKKKIADYSGIDRMEMIRNADRTQNVAVMKTRALVMKYEAWEKPSRLFRIWISILSAVIVTLAIFNYFKVINYAEKVDFWAIAALLFAFCFLFWGAVVETYWKQVQLGRMQKEFQKTLRLSSNPLEARDKMQQWISGNPYIKESVRKMLEGMLDKWLRQDLKME